MNLGIRPLTTSALLHVFDCHSDGAKYTVVGWGTTASTPPPRGSRAGVGFGWGKHAADANFQTTRSLLCPKAIN